MTAEKGRRAHRIRVVGDLLLALPPALVVVASALMVTALRHERILFASLASSAFLIYRDPAHPMNGVRIMVSAHIVATAIGIASSLILGPGYIAAGVAMVSTMAILIVLRIVHPPAASTAVGFGFFMEQDRVAGVFLIAVVMMAALIVTQRIATWTAHRVEAYMGAR